MPARAGDGSAFWADAGRYARGAADDAPFAEELAYLLVTLHRTGA